MRLALALLLLVSNHARADSDLVAQNVVLDAHRFELATMCEIDMQANIEGRQLSLAPDVWFGLTRDWTVGITHSNASISRIGAGTSFCSGPDCERTYDNMNVDVRYRASDRIAPRLRVLVRDVDPWKPALAFGVLARWSRGPVAITTDPYLRFGIANTDRGNRTAINVPVVVEAQASRVAIGLHTGYNSDVAVWYDGCHIPVAFGARVRVVDRLDAGTAFGFSSALGPQDSAKLRVLWFWVHWR